MHLSHLLSSAVLFLATADAFMGSRPHKGSKWKQHVKRTYFPTEAQDMFQFTTKENVTIRYKMPGKAGICETTPGVNSYSGFVDLAPDVHVFFWFFESRRDPANDDFTLWLNGGPGSDSLIGLFEELGPCRITPELKTVINPYSWNNISNMLFLSQPVGTGFSNQGIMNGSIDNFLGTFLNSSYAKPDGTWSLLNPLNRGSIDTTDLAAMAAWHVLQGFLEGLPYMTANRAYEPKNFNLWTESYGGHYGPAFFDYFYKQNEKIKKGSVQGYPLNFKSLGIFNGIISELTQAEYYPEMAVNNTYGIKAYNDTVYSYARFATFMIGGCYAQIQSCIQAASDIAGGFVKGRITTLATQNPSLSALCSEAADMCRDNVESMYYNYGGRGTYDIRHPAHDPTPPEYEIEYLNQGWVQQALGVSSNYTTANDDVYWNFQASGDFIYPNFLADLGEVIDSGVRVALAYGDADYICNWMGGQAVSLEVNHTTKPQFAAAGYQPFMYAGTQYGETREYGNYSFTRVYEAGHEVPYYQPEAAFAHFQRVIDGVDIPNGLIQVTKSLASNGTANSTHTEPPVSLPPTGTAAYVSYSTSIIGSYSSLDNEPVVTGMASA